MTRIAITLVIFSVCLLPVNNNIYAQACCSGGTPLSSNLGIQSVSARSLNIQLTYDYNTQRDLVVKSKKLQDDRRDRNTRSVLLRSTYAFDDKISFSTLFSFITQEEEVRSNFGTGFKSANGIGDVAAILQYQLFDRADLVCTMAGGLKLPLGATDRVDEQLGILLNPDLQPGTGSVDYLLGVNLTRNHIFQPNLNFLYVSTLRLTAPADRFGGQLEYEFGNEWQNLFGLQYSHVFKAFILNPSFLIRYRIANEDFSNGQTVANTGGQWVHLVPGFDFLLTPNWSVGISGEIPLYRYLNGTQLTTTYRFKLTLDYQFSFSEK